MTRVISLLMGTLFFGVSCQSPEEDCCAGPDIVVLGEPFSINEGETINVESSSIILTFTDLLSDSLCPEDVQCVTQGSLSIAIDISGTSRSLSIGDNQSPTTEYKDYTIELQRLVYPTKQSEKDNLNSTYSVQMIINRS